MSIFVSGSSESAIGFRHLRDSHGWPIHARWIDNPPSSLVEGEYGEFNRKIHEDIRAAKVHLVYTNRSIYDLLSSQSLIEIGISMAEHKAILPVAPSLTWDKPWMYHQCVRPFLLGASFMDFFNDEKPEARERVARCLRGWVDF